MAWLGGSTSFLTCDDSKHKGERAHKMIHGVKVSADEAARATGWKKHTPTGAFICPLCVKRLKSIDN